MATMSFGYVYNRGLKVGYDIHFGKFVLFNVSSKDKNRILTEIKKNGYDKCEIHINRVIL